VLSVTGSGSDRIDGRTPRPVAAPAAGEEG
jgi:hypothetical protein